MKTGDTFESRTGQVYTLVTIHDDGGLTISRNSTGKLVKVPAGLIERTRERIAKGVTLKPQRSEKQGGISYTVAIESGVCFALGLQVGWTK